MVSQHWCEVHKKLFEMELLLGIFVPQGWDSLSLFSKMAIDHLLATYFIIKVPSENILTGASHMHCTYLVICTALIIVLVFF